MQGKIRWCPVSNSSSCDLNILSPLSSKPECKDGTWDTLVCSKGEFQSAFTANIYVALPLTSWSKFKRSQ